MLKIKTPLPQGSGVFVLSGARMRPIYQPKSGLSYGKILMALVAFATELRRA